jgi:deoxyribose-phosphate aldolase
VGKYPPIDPDSLSREDLVRLIDFSLLKPEETLVDYARFIKTAAEWGFGAVFVPPFYIPMACGMLSGTTVAVGTPISFPFGYTDSATKAAEALSAIEEGARDIDIVMNISAARSGEWEIVEDDLSDVVEAVRIWEKSNLKGPVVVKAILETSYLDRGQKEESCRRAVSAGVDFVKTGTGIAPGSASPEDVSLIRSVVGDDVAVKAAGGVRTWRDVRALIAAGACRIGTSAGPEIMEGFLRETGTG